MENNPKLMFSLSEYEEKARGRSTINAIEENHENASHFLFSIISSISEDTKFSNDMEYQEDYNYFQSSSVITAY